MVEKIIAFDEAVGEAVRFADNHPGTLVIVTADHETGGMTINDGMLSGEKMDIGWSTRGHTAVSVPIYSTGAGAGLFTGWFDNTDIPKKINKLLGLENFLSGRCGSLQ
jgi:alkaline phosphatase